eukprot:2283228-Pleurochrysis_carterae.AAC.1
MNYVRHFLSRHHAVDYGGCCFVARTLAHACESLFYTAFGRARAAPSPSATQQVTTQLVTTQFVIVTTQFQWPKKPPPS